MVPGSYNFPLTRGSYWSDPFDFKVSGVAMNLTGYAARMTFRDVASDAVVFTLTTANGGISTASASSGRLTPAILATLFATVSFGITALRFDFELIPPSGEDYAQCYFRGITPLDQEQSR